MLPKYEHTQKGSKLIYYLMVFVLLEMVAINVFVYIMATHSEDSLAPNELTHVMLLTIGLPILIFGWVFLLMHSLTVSVDSDYVRIRFGPGVWMKKFRLEHITDCRPVKNDWINGWGIHYIGKHCWLYNIAGMQAVELTFKNGKKNRIGTDEPEKLAEAIHEAIGEN